jgi:hypothetical protein
MSIDERLVKLEADQLGLVTMAQALEAGVSYKALRVRQQRGLLVAERPGVLAAANAPETFERRLLAAVLAAGETAFASHASAAHLWVLPLPAPAELEITTVLERRPRLDGVLAHRSGLLIDPDVTQLGSIPVSTPERTIVDLSSRLEVRALGRVVDEALRLRITTLNRIHWMTERLPRAPGRSPHKMREVLRRRIPGSEERESILEDFVFEALRRFVIPLPIAQHTVQVKGKTRRIDLCYPPSYLALEAKGFEYHGHRERFDDDALRGNELKLAGWQVLEFTSAFTDWMIATQVAEALGVPTPPRPANVMTFAEWKRVR